MLQALCNSQLGEPTPGMLCISPCQLAPSSTWEADCSSRDAPRQVRMVRWPSGVTRHREQAEGELLAVS